MVNAKGKKAAKVKEPTTKDVALLTVQLMVDEAEHGLARLKVKRERIDKKIEAAGIKVEALTNIRDNMEGK